MKSVEKSFSKHKVQKKSCSKHATLTEFRKSNTYCKLLSTYNIFYSYNNIKTINNHCARMIR